MHLLPCTSYEQGFYIMTNLLNFLTHFSQYVCSSINLLFYFTSFNCINLGYSALETLKAVMLTKLTENKLN